MKTFSYFLILYFFTITHVIDVFPLEKNAKMHFSSEQVSKDNGVELADKWEFYWNKHLKPGEFSDAISYSQVSLDNWTKYLDKKGNHLPSLGYATYRLQFSIDKTDSNLALYVPRIIGAYKLWINGKLVKELGKAGKNKSSTLHRRFTKIIPVNNSNTSFEIVIQVSNFYNKTGGITEPLYFGESNKMLLKKGYQHTVDMILIGSLGFIGLLFLFFYFFFWNKDIAIFYFSVFCFALAYHTANDRYAPLAMIFDDISWVFLTKIEYLASHIFAIAASLFFAEIIPKGIHRFYKRIIIISILICSAFVIILPPPYFTYLIMPFLIIILINICYGLFISARAIKFKSDNSRLLLLTVITALVVFFLNIIFFILKNQNGLIFVKYGYIFAFVFMSLLLLQRFSKSFSKLESSNKTIFNQSKELEEINLMLSSNVKKLEASNSELDDFNHIVSHDLKSPLISINALTGIIENDLKDSLSDKTKKSLKYLKEVVTEMKTSIDGLLEYSRVGSEKKSLDSFKINDLLKNLGEHFNYQKPNKIIFPEQDIVVTINRIELEHVFQNLISNSIKYNDKEKAIVTITAKELDNEYVFSVSDNGPGVPEKYHEQIFKVFNKLQNSSKEESTGIGLAIVKKIVTKNNGEINVSSKENKGLTITFSWLKS